MCGPMNIHKDRQEREETGTKGQEGRDDMKGDTRDLKEKVPPFQGM